jgi:hypothetical protein
MATSGSINLSADGAAIVTEALEQLSVLAEGQAPNANQYTSSLRTLNMMLKAWQASPGGTNLFALQKVYVFMQKGQQEYTLSASSSDHLTTSFVYTTVATAASETDTTITVSSVTGITDTYNIGIELGSGSLQWTTVSGAPAGSVVTLADALTDDVTAGATVYVYQTKAQRPMAIIEAVRRTASNEVDLPLESLNLRDFTTLNDKTTSSSVLQYYYEPKRTTGSLTVWPVPSTADDYLVLWVRRTLEDVDASTDEVDYPQEWFMAIALNLALLLAPKYGIASGDFQKIALLARDYKDMAESGDTEQSVSFQPHQGW